MSEENLYSAKIIFIMHYEILKTLKIEFFNSIKYIIELQNDVTYLH